MTRYILTIAGEGSRWGDYLGVRKHFAPINGEPLILRTIRQIRQFDKDAEIYIGQNPEYKVSIPNVIIYDGTTYKQGAESDRYFVSVPFWNKEGRTVLIWGDVYFTDNAIKELTKPSNNWLRYGRIGGSSLKGWGEEFAISFNPEHHNLMLESCKKIENLSLQVGHQLYGAIYLAMLGVSDDDIIRYSTSGLKPNLGNMVEINDETDDFDFPSDYDKFITTSKMNPKILIGLPTAEYARRADFYDYLALIQIPEGSFRSNAHGQSPARNRNLIIQQALDYECTHIMFLDDDCEHPPDIIHRLLAHDKDVVTGLYLMRNFPHQPIIFDKALDDGRCLHHFLQENETGLVPIVNCGLGAVLIKIEVFKKMKKPWITLGEAEPDHWCDDISFFNRVRKLGFKMYCDLTVQVGHQASVTIHPAYENGKWFVVYDTQGTGKVSFPMPTPILVNEKDEKIA